MGLFDKKFCDICGEKIGLLGNRKLSDGNMCKDCAKKLSPWFSERKASTKAEIEQQLAYREANKNAVASFNATRTMGVDTRVLVDERTMKFMVTSAKNIVDANPDVIDCSAITGCRIDVRDRKTEEKYRNQDGQMVSYNPPRYTYYYDFDIIINVNHPYFDEIKFSPVNANVKVESAIRGNISTPQSSGIIGRMVGNVIAAVDPTHNSEYLRRQDMCNEIVRVLTGSRESAIEEVRATAAKPAAPQPVQCPYCGAMNQNPESGMCEFCGGKL